MNPKEEDTKDYFAEVMKQKREERIIAAVVAILTIFSLVGTYMGVHTLYELSAPLAYILLGSTLRHVVILFFAFSHNSLYSTSPSSKSILMPFLMTQKTKSIGPLAPQLQSI